MYFGLNPYDLYYNYRPYMYFFYTKEINFNPYFSYIQY